MCEHKLFMSGEILYVVLSYVFYKVGSKIVCRLFVCDGIKRDLVVKICLLDRKITNDRIMNEKIRELVLPKSIYELSITLY